MYRRASARLADAGATIVMPLVGRYATSMEMTGATVTLCRLDAELERQLLAPCHCAFWTVT
jgi:dihydroxyacetone kinase-like protein